MRKRHPYENRYCNACKCTTRHEVKDAAFTCLRCGSVKVPPRVMKPVARPLPMSA
ncbi:MAG: hypothetical protein M5U26_04445 [Planctomycetota bacterium]|nr:hypothetical protein [Planctomycetota bacterium]